METLQLTCKAPCRLSHKLATARVSVCRTCSSSSSSSRIKGFAPQLQKFRLSSSNCFSCVFKRTKIYASTTTAQTKDISKDSQKFENRQWEHTNTRLQDIFPTPVRNFPWKVAFMKVMTSVIEGAAKWLVTSILIITFIQEVSFSMAHDKEMLVPFALFCGCMVAETIKNTAQEISGKFEDKHFPFLFTVVASACMLIKIMAPTYSFWWRILLPHFATGVLWQTLWSAMNWFRNLPQGSQVAGDENQSPMAELK